MTGADDLYKKGYRDGYRDGRRDQRRDSVEDNKQPLVPNNPDVITNQCSVCKINFGTGCWGYVCSRNDCPTRVISWNGTASTKFTG